MNLFCVMALQLTNDIHKERLSVVSLACVFSLLYGHSYTSTHYVCVCEVWVGNWLMHVFFAKL